MQTPSEALVEILRQQEIIQQLVEEVERLKTNASSDSRSSSKPPSSDIHRRSEQRRSGRAAQAGKRKPGGQPGHEGKPAKDLDGSYEVVRASECSGWDGIVQTPECAALSSCRISRTTHRVVE